LLLTCRRFAAMTVVFAAAGCSASVAPGSDEPCPAGFLGSRAAAPDFDIQVLLADDTVATIQDGGTAPMLVPPQGGRVIFAGVRATNVDGCGLQLTGALRDLSTGRVTLDSRTINLTAVGDGWGASAAASESTSAAIGAFSNVPVCPNEWSATDLFGHAYGLEVTVVDREKRQLTKKIQVTPECGQPDDVEQCMCICRAGYVLGQACGDAGNE
jgi:hypothetical protein